MPCGAANAQASCGLKLEYSNIDSGSFLEICDIIDLDGPSIEVTSVEKTHLQSPDCFKEFMAGFGDGGEVTFRINTNSVNMTILYGMLRESFDWRITHPDEQGTWEFEAFITALGGGDVPEDDRVTSEVTLKVSGKPVYASS
jgi:hypothetical protein